MTDMDHDTTARATLAEPPYETAARIVKKAQSACSSGDGCICTVRPNDCGRPGDELVLDIAHAIEDAASAVRALPSAEDAARTFFDAAFAEMKRLEPGTTRETSWDADEPEAKLGRECFTAGARAVLAMIDTDQPTLTTPKEA
jgi:hypothetical protein